MVRFVKAVAAVLFLQSASWVVVWGCYDASAQAQGGEQVHWDYSLGPLGPAHWNELKHDWKVCKMGMQQSPIDIAAHSMVIDRSLRKLDARYRQKINATIANDGHAIVVDLPPSSGFLRINGVRYQPLEFHFHMPSEHTVMNQSFPLEYHLVHKSEDGKLAVIAFLFVEGEESDFLAQFTEKLPLYKNSHFKTNIGNMKLMKLQQNYGHYMGSLTTPPCTENVTWTIMLWNFPTVSAQQLKDIRGSVPHDNNRPTIPSTGRNFQTSF